MNFHRRATATGFGARLRPWLGLILIVAFISASTYVLLLCPCDRPTGTRYSIFLVSLSGLFALVAAAVLYLRLRKTLAQPHSSAHSKPLELLCSRSTRSCEWEFWLSNGWRAITSCGPHASCSRPISFLQLSRGGRHSSSKLAQVMVHMQVAPAHTLFLAHHPKEGMRLNPESRGEAVNRSSNSKSSRLSLSKSAGPVPPAFGSHSGTVGTPCGHLNGSHNAAQRINGPEYRFLTGSAGFSPIAIRNASLKWQIIWATVIFPHRRWLSGPIALNRRTISALSFAFKSVFIAVAIRSYFALAGGTMPFIRRYSTICP